MFRWRSDSISSSNDPIQESPRPTNIFWKRKSLKRSKDEQPKKSLSQQSNPETYHNAMQEANFIQLVDDSTNFEDECVLVCSNLKNNFSASKQLAVAKFDRNSEIIFSNINQAVVLSIIRLIDEYIDLPLKQLQSHIQRTQELIDSRNVLLEEFRPLQSLQSQVSPETKSSKFPKDNNKYEVMESAVKEMTAVLLSNLNALQSIYDPFQKKIGFSIATILKLLEKSVKEYLESVPSSQEREQLQNSYNDYIDSLVQNLNILSNIISEGFRLFDDDNSQNIWISRLTSVYNSYLNRIYTSQTLPKLITTDGLEEFEQALASQVSANFPMFGTDLILYNAIPNVILQCVRYLNSTGLSVEGIFRVSGDEDKIQELRRQYLEGSPINFNAFDSDGQPIYSVYDIASLLKLYFRELPNPLIPRLYYHPFLDTSSTDDTTFLATMRDLLSDSEVDVPSEATDIAHGQPQALAANQLEGGSVKLLPTYPTIHKKCLVLLLGLLVKITQHSEENKMTADNLAVVFAPTIMQPPKIDGTSSFSMLRDTQRTITFTKKLIQRAAVIIDDFWQKYEDMIVVDFTI